MKKRYAVMRRPTLPEDEGYPCEMKQFRSEKRAQKWIRSPRGGCLAGYFQPDDFYIVYQPKG